MPDTVVVREDDPRCLELEAHGYRVVGRSWGARLLLGEPPNLNRLEGAVAHAQAAGFVVRELDPSSGEALFHLELSNNTDYPFTPATFQPPPTLTAIQGYWENGKRVFGALCDERLVGAVVGEIREGVGHNDFASVLAKFRRAGIGEAVASAAIIAFAGQGVRNFTAGGAEANEASMGLVRTLGFTIDEQWRSYQRQIFSTHAWHTVDEPGATVKV